MSPTLVDFRTPTNTPQMQAKQSSLQNPNPKGQISSSSLLFDFAGVSSNNLFSEQNQSEIRNANERNFDHSFSSPPSVSRLGSEKPVMGTSSGLSKPRLVKLRKHFVSQQTRSTGKKVESGFNPFRPATDTLNDQWTSWNPFSSNSAQKSKSFTGSNDFEFLKPENSGFVFGVNDRSTDSNFKTNGLGENLGTSLPDEMTKLNIGRETNERVNLNSGKVSQKHEDESFVFNVGKSLPDEIRKMNIGKDTKEREVNLNSGEVYEKHENAGFAFAANDRSTDSNLRTSGLGENVGQSLPNEMRKLNIGRETKEGVVNLNSDEVSKNHGFVFGSSSKENPGLNENKVSKLPDEMRKLNIESSGVSDVGEKTKDTNFSSQVNGKNTFIFGRSNKIPDAVFQNTVFKLPHEMNELKIEDFGNASGVEKTKDASSSKTNDKNTFSSGGSMDFAGSMSGSSENTLPDDMKKLNIQGSRSGDEPEKTKNAFSQFDYKKAFGLESDKNNAGSYGGSTSSMLPGEMEKLNIGSKTGDSGVFNDSTGGNSIPPFTFRAGVQGKSSGVESVPHSDSKLGEVPGFQSVGNTFEVPSMDGAENKAGFRQQVSSPRGGGGGGGGGGAGSNSSLHQQVVIPVNSVGYEVFLLMLQYLYSGQVSIVPQKHEPRPNCGERGCWHTHCTSAVDLALDTLAAARSFGVEQLALLTQKQLASMVEKASIEDVMKVLIASRKQDMHQLWTTCSHLVAKSGLPPEVLAKHLPIDVVAKIEELRLKSSIARRSPFPHHHHQYDLSAAADLEDQKIRRMRRALDSSDVELVKLMVMGEGLNLDEALALHYAVENCSREVVKALLELGAADVNYQAGPAGKTPLHLAAEMVCPDMVAVLLDHHADPNVRTVDGITPLDILRTLTSDFLFKGVVPGLSHIEPNKLRLCLELVQSAALVLSREDGNGGGGGGGGCNTSSTTQIYPPRNTDLNSNNSNSSGSSSNNNNNNNNFSLSLDSRLVYLNLGAAAAAQLGCKMDGDQDENSPNNQRGIVNRHGSSQGGHEHHPSMYHSHDF